MTIKTKTKIEFHDDVRHKMTGFGEIGFNGKGGFIVQMNSDKPIADTNSWNYCTVLPISSAESRIKYGTKVCVKDCGASLVITDDHGTSYEFKADREIIEHLLSECEAQQIVKLPDEEQLKLKSENNS